MSQNRKRGSLPQRIDAKPRRIAATLDAEFHRRVRVHAAAHGLTVNELVRSALEVALRGAGYYVGRPPSPAPASPAKIADETTADADPQTDAA